MNFPKNLKYNDDYSWIKLENGVALIGVIEMAAKKVEEFVFVMLPELNSKLKKGETYVTLEAVKWSGQLKSPVSGKVIEVNDVLFDQPAKINQDPYGSWIVKVEIESSDQLLSHLEAIEFYKKK